MLDLFSTGVTFATRSVLDCLTGAGRICAAVRENFHSDRETQQCLRALLEEVVSVVSTRCLAAGGLEQAVPKLNYSGRRPQDRADKAQQLRARLSQDLDLPFEDYELTKLSEAFTLASSSPVRGWDGSIHQNAHLA